MFCFKKTSLKSLRLRKLLDQSDFSYWALLGPSGSLRVLLGPSGSFWTLVSLSGPYWALMGFTGPYWALLGLTGPYWALLGLTGPYWASLGLMEQPASGSTFGLVCQNPLNRYRKFRT